MINFIKLSEVQKDDLSKVKGGINLLKPIAMYAVHPPIILDYGVEYPDYGISYPDYGVSPY